MTHWQITLKVSTSHTRRARCTMHAPLSSKLERMVERELRRGAEARDMREDERERDRQGHACNRAIRRLCSAYGGHYDAQRRRCGCRIGVWKTIVHRAARCVLVHLQTSQDMCGMESESDELVQGHVQLREDAGATPKAAATTDIWRRS